MKKMFAGLTRVGALALLALTGLALTACEPQSTGSGPQPQPAPSGPVFRILAGSELKDVVGKVEEFAKTP